jgi:5-methylcytosine-specific restriction endonuclease McrA
MTINTDAKNMSSRSEKGPELSQLASERDEDHFIFERDGFRCQICGEIGHPHELDDDLMLAHPPFPEEGPIDHITVCGDCWRAHTDEQLDEYVEEMQEQQRALKDDRGDYEQNRERAFERDDYTCQLCGKEGYPKTERGLVAYPVCAGDFHLDNLVTICNDCITDTLDSDEDDQKAADRLRIQAARAKEWVNTDDERPEHPTDEESGGGNR